MGRRPHDTQRAGRVSPGGATRRELANHEIVRLAVYLLGGDRQPVDTEEMLEVGGRPVIDYPVQRMRAAARDELHVVTRLEKDLALTRTPFIGDDERDALAAHAAGCPTGLVSEKLLPLDLARLLLAEGAEVAAR